MAKLITYCFYIVLLFNCTACSEGKAGENNRAKKVIAEEKNYRRINNNLDNFTIRGAQEDLETFRINKKPVYSIKHYKAESGKNNARPVKKIGGETFYLQSYTEYLKDGRKRYKEYVYDQTKRVENYHYDGQFENLILLHRIEPNPKNERNYYSILNYHSNKVLKEEIAYRTYQGTDFDVEGYTNYQFRKNADTITISVSDIGYDSIPAPQDTYTFVGDALFKQKPRYQSKKQYFKWVAEAYKPIKTEGYIFDDRNVQFTYNEQGFVTSEIWIKNGALENKKEYAYNADYTERIEQDYHRRGTEKSTKHIRKYNLQGDLIFEQMVEYTGNQLNPLVFEYVYDEHGNWTERKKLRLELKDGNKSTLLQHELREIVYFDSNSKVRQLKLPALSEKVGSVAKTLPKLAGEKQKALDAFNTAVEEGNYAMEITKTEAREIKDFTPKFWKLKATAFGDLDKLPGEEAVAVFETPIMIDPGFEQVLAIFKRKGNQWTLWHQSATPILGTQGGGMMGNPFDGISVANRTIIVNHFGGSRQKWRYKHVYRYQNNDWYVIGASVHFGAPCDYFIDFDYNLSTGDVIAGYERENCDDDVNHKNGAKQWKERFKRKAPLPKMDGFVPGDNKIIIPNVEYEVYY